jgi:gamma-tubulin complex component 2
MASLKRDTPAGRAALARRRQRAAQVVDHNARFGLEEGDDSNNQSPPTSDRNLQNYQQQDRQRDTLQSQQSQHTAPSPSRSGQQRDPPPQRNRNHEVKNPQRNNISKDPPQRGIPSSVMLSPTSYSTARLPTSDELLERSSQVAKTAASVLASARKTMNPQRDLAYVADSKSSEWENDAPDSEVPIEKSSITEIDPVQTRMVYQTPAQTVQAANATFADSVVEKSPPTQPQNTAQFQSPAMGVFTSNPETTLGRDDQRIVQSEPLYQSAIGAEDQNHFQLPEEEITTEECEPVISTQNGSEQLDATCLRSGSHIMLRSMAASAMVTITASPQDRSNGSAAMVGGAGLGTSEEVFQLFKSDGSLRSLIEEDDTLLRWGDNVALLTISHNQTNDVKALGVRKRSSVHFSVAPMIDRISWSRPSGGQIDTFTLVRGDVGSKQGVRVGLSASQAAKALKDRRAARGECTRVVQSGDPVLLRHDQTGGLLSVKMADGSLQLVSDSYDSNRGDAFREGLSTSNGLMGQLQMHDRYVPTDKDTFSFVLASSPPCPRWIGTSASCSQTLNPYGHRMYLHQSYLTEASRNVTNHLLQEKLFENIWSSLSSSDEPNPAENLSLTEQESIMIDEVLGACLGLEGRHICARERNEWDPSNILTAQNIEFCLKDCSQLLFDASLRNLAERVLPLGASYLHVSAFVASHMPGYEHGSVMQAFCEALSGMLQEYATYLANLEDEFRKPQSGANMLTMRKLHACLMPSLHTMAILEKATTAVAHKIGGCLLNCLSSLKSWSCEGDLVANSVLGNLLEKSSIPYMHMLTTWLQDGLLQDPYKEFMIEVEEKSSGSAWQNSKAKESFVLKEEHVLTELLSSEVLLQKVEATGKYWRAVKACEVVLRKKTTICEDVGVQHSATPTLQHYLNFGSMAAFIQSRYDAASSALVNLLMKDFNLMGALRSMKQYFLLDHGDFLLHFLDSAEDELLKELGDISTGRIQHWLRMSVQLTELNGSRADARSTPSKSPTLSPLALRCRFQPISLTNRIDSINMQGPGSNGANEGIQGRDGTVMETPQDTYGMSNKGLTGVETFVLDFPVVPFPISMVLTDGAISKYQLLFSLLFNIKHVERRLLRIWEDHQAMKELNSVRGLFGPTFLLRQKMLHFAQNLIYYFMFEIIEPNFLEMERQMVDPATAGRRTVDNIVEVHEAFLQRTVEACLLTNRELVGTLTKLMTTCLMFADQMKLFTEATRIVSINWLWCWFYTGVDPWRIFVNAFSSVCSLLQPPLGSTTKARTSQPNVGKQFNAA